MPAREINNDGLGSCAACGGAARSLPGESYAEEDAALFGELAVALHNAELTPLQAARLAEELEGKGGSLSSLQRLAQLLPSLQSLDVVIATPPGAARKANGMLKTLLKVKAAGRSQSGLLPTVSAMNPGRKAAPGER